MHHQLSWLLHWARNYKKPAWLVVTLVCDQCTTSPPGPFIGDKFTKTPAWLVATPVYGKFTTSIPGSYTDVKIIYIKTALLVVTLVYN
jgi:hypothetical protein